MVITPEARRAANQVIDNTHRPGYDIQGVRDDAMRAAFPHLLAANLPAIQRHLVSLGITIWANDAEFEASVNQAIRTRVERLPDHSSGHPEWAEYGQFGKAIHRAEFLASIGAAKRVSE